MNCIMEWLKPPRFSEAEKEKQTLCVGNLLLECRFCFEKGDIPDEKRKTYVFEECIKKNREKKKKFNNLLPPGVDPSAFRS